MTDKDRQIIENRKQVCPAFCMTEGEYAMKEAREMLLECFPGSFVNSRDEFIAHPRTNQYFILRDCKTPEDIEAKVLEWLSRASFKSRPYSQEWRNRRFHADMRFAVNAYLDTDFSEDDMGIIYTYLGNAINHGLTLDFIDHCMDIDWLKSACAYTPNLRSMDSLEVVL